MAVLNRMDWYDLARTTNWTPGYVTEDELFPPPLAGAFGLQWGIGGFVDALQAGGWATDAAYRTAFLTLLGGQALALVWLLLPARRA